MLHLLLDEPTLVLLMIKLIMLREFSNIEDIALLLSNQLGGEILIDTSFFMKAVTGILLLDLLCPGRSGIPKFASVSLDLPPQFRQSHSPGKIEIYGRELGLDQAPTSPQEMGGLEQKIKNIKDTPLCYVRETK